jgi:hypothetical protein
MVLQDCAKGPYGRAAQLRRGLESVFGPSYMCYSLAYGYLTVEDLEDYNVIIVDGSGEDFETVSDWLMREGRKGASTGTLLEAFVDRGKVVWFNAAVVPETPLEFQLPFGAVLRQSGAEIYRSANEGILSGTYPTELNHQNEYFYPVNQSLIDGIAHGSIGSYHSYYTPLIVDSVSGSALLVSGLESLRAEQVLLGSMTPGFPGYLSILEILCSKKSP